MDNIPSLTAMLEKDLELWQGRKNKGQEPASISLLNGTSFRLRVFAPELKVPEDGDDRLELCGVVFTRDRKAKAWNPMWTSDYTARMSTDDYGRFICSCPFERLGIKWEQY